jgi:hypothetical protein
MIKGGKGGANTNKTGLLFERETSLETALVDAGFQVVADEILQDSKKLGLLMEKAKLYRFLDAKDVDWRKIVSTRLLPDEAVFSYSSNSLTIVEKKWQEVSGSVDEKLQTSGFKLRQYRNLFAPLGANVKYIYLLNDWFTQPRYSDVLEYIRESGADYHFKSLPLALLDL